MRGFSFAHPTDANVVASFGWDHVRGYWCEIRCGSERADCVDWMSPGFDLDRPLRSVLDALASRGFFGDSENLDLAFLALAEGVDEHLGDPDQKRAVRVIRRLQKLSE